MLQNWTRVPESPLIAASAALLLAAAAADLAVRLVPNALCALLAAAGLALRAGSGTLAAGTLAAACVFALGFLCWRRGWMGGGDVKLLAAATLTVPPLLAPRLLLAVALAGGALAGLYLLLGAMLPPVRPDAGHGARGVVGILRRERRRIARRGPVPYAAAIAAGTVFVLMLH
ncbi:MAG TPA: A24 family peptidase [Acetobacteraceae bacterium]|nr:A24 family peptidase [Acetobacteraceae bacterium]